jgi:3-polyprenyl-4-hydroxybenzoate decarboxylase
MPAFYARPASLDEMVDNIVGRVLARAGVENKVFEVWEGLNKDEDS